MRIVRFEIAISNDQNSNKKLILVFFVILFTISISTSILNKYFLTCFWLNNNFNYNFNQIYSLIQINYN
jgi:hypothetical protein